MFDKLRIESQLAELRKRWENEPSRRDIIKIQGLALKRALELHKNDPVNSYEYLQETLK